MAQIGYSQSKLSHSIVGSYGIEPTCANSLSSIDLGYDDSLVIRCPQLSANYSHYDWDNFLDQSVEVNNFSTPSFPITTNFKRLKDSVENQSCLAHESLQMEYQIAKTIRCASSGNITHRVCKPPYYGQVRSPNDRCEASIQDLFGDYCTFPGESRSLITWQPTVLNSLTHSNGGSCSVVNDKDGDFVPDQEDACPDTGPIQNPNDVYNNWHITQGIDITGKKGCLSGDSDSDGILDSLEGPGCVSENDQSSIDIYPKNFRVTSLVGCARCDDLLTHQGRTTLFKKSFRANYDTKKRPSVTGYGIEATFEPFCLSNPGVRVPPKVLATQMGFDHFNFHQQYQEFNQVYEILETDAIAFNNGSKNEFLVGEASLVADRSWLIDPIVQPLQGGNQLARLSVKDGVGNTFSFPGDSLPFYYNENGGDPDHNIARFTFENRVFFRDYPYSYPGYYDSSNPYTLFQLGMVAVNANGQSFQFGPKIWWNSTAERIDSITNPQNNVARWPVLVRASTTLVDPALIQGSSEFVKLVPGPEYYSPNLVGKNINDKEYIEQLSVENINWKVVKEVYDPNELPGTIVSQYPYPYQSADNIDEIEIQVAVDSVIEPDEKVYIKNRRGKVFEYNFYKFGKVWYFDNKTKTAKICQNIANRHPIVDANGNILDLTEAQCIALNESREFPQSVHNNIEAQSTARMLQVSGLKNISAEDLNKDIGVRLVRSTERLYRKASRLLRMEAKLIELLNQNKPNMKRIAKIEENARIIMDIKINENIQRIQKLRTKLDQPPADLDIENFFELLAFPK